MAWVTGLEEFSVVETSELGGSESETGLTGCVKWDDKRLSAAK